MSYPNFGWTAANLLCLALERKAKQRRRSRGGAGASKSAKGCRWAPAQLDAVVAQTAEAKGADAGELAILNFPRLGAGNWVIGDREFPGRTHERRLRSLEKGSGRGERQRFGQQKSSLGCIS